MSERNFHILTFGCQMNVRDSSWLESSLKNAGFMASPLEEASIIIINTCSVREKPEKKVANLLRQIAGATHNDPRVIVGVTGCVAQQPGADLFKLSPQLRLVCGTDALASIPAALEKLLLDPQLKIHDTSFQAIYPERKKVAENWPHGSALVNIMQGCDNFCAYCIVPYTRGRQKSRLKKEILEECKMVLDNGATEISLLGQNVNAWGKDNGAGNFPDLLTEIAGLPGLRRLHFITPHPADMEERSIKAFGELENLSPRLHLPLQSGSDRILGRMRRRYDRAGFIKLVQALRDSRADLALSTDLIVGFPGETEADFNDTLEMMEICSFMSSFSFCYSDRPGTRSSLMPDKIANDIKLERLSRLQNLQDKLSAQWLEGRLHSETEILVEAPSLKRTKDPDQWQGRDPYGMVVNASLANVRPGEYKKVYIEAAGKHSLKGRLILDNAP